MNGDRSALAAMLLLSGGCFGSDEPSSGPIALEELSARVAESFCRLIEPCCPEGASFDQQSCVRMLGDGVFDVDVADPAKYSYDANAAGACLDALDGLGNLCSDSAMTLSTMPDACGVPFQGTVPPGGACAASIECARPTGGDVDCDEGVCIVERTAAEGEACYWTCTRRGAGYSCGSSNVGIAGTPVEQGRCYTNDGLHCSSGRVCARREGLGGACARDGGCQDELYCDFLAGTCQSRLGAGMPCTGGDCQQGHYCDSGTRTCALQAQSGSPCSDSDACLDGFCDAGICVDEGALGGLGLLFCGGSARLAP